jgi:hypothetical protein
MCFAAKRHGSPHYHAAQIVKAHRNGTYVVQFQGSGVALTLPRDRIRTVSDTYDKGDTVNARRHGSRKFYAAAVRRVHSDGNPLPASPPLCPRHG